MLYSSETKNATPARPNPRQVIIENIPEELKQRNQWCLWRYKLRRKPETGEWDWTKVPKTPLGGNARSNSPSTWSSFAACMKRYEHGRFDGIGFFFSPDDGLVGIDLDKGVAQYQDIIATINSYTEISPSGNGVRIIAKGTLPPNDRRNGHVEMYDNLRFLTITGHRLEGTPATVEERQAEIEKVHHQYVARPKQPKPESNGKPKASSEHILDQITLEDVLAVATTAENGDKFRRTWEGHWDRAGYHSASEADQGLASMLAFYLNGEYEAVLKAMLASGMISGREHKWHREDYRRRTIERVLDQDAYYDWSPVLEAKRTEKGIEETVEPFEPEDYATADTNESEPDNTADTNESESEPDTNTTANTTASKPAISFIGIDEILDNAAEPEDWLIENWLEFGSLAMLTGDPFAGKSCLVAELIAGILKWRKFGAYSVPHCPVLMIDLENNDKKHKRRLAASLEKDWDAARGHLARVVINDEGVLPLDAPKVEKLIRHFQKATKQEKVLVVIDTFRSVFDADEMDVQQTKKLLYPLQRVAQRTNTAILVLHHRPKSGAKYSGQSSIPGALDYLWCFESDKDTLIGALTLEGTRGDPQPPMEFKLTDGRNVYQNTGTSNQEQLEQLVKKLLAKDEEWTQTHLVKTLRNMWKGNPPGRDKLIDMVKGLEGSLIYSQKGKDNRLVYRLIGA